MPKYFFDTREGNQRTTDLDGTELAGRHLVAHEARRLLLDVTQDLKVAGDRFQMEVSVRDEAGVAIHWSSLLLEAKWVAT